MKFFRVFCLGIMAILVSSCAQKSHKVVAKPIKYQTQTRNFKSFSAIKSEGDVNLVLEPSSSKFTVQLQGDPRDFQPTTTTVKNNILFITYPSYLTKHGPITALVSSKQLRMLKYNGNGNISAKHLSTSLLDLDLHVNGNVNLDGKIALRKIVVSGKNKVRLKGISSKWLQVLMHDKVDVKIQGMMNLRHLEFEGSGTLGISWLNSSDLDLIGSGDAKVYLAGKAHYMHAVTDKNVEVDARYLRVTKAYVKARGHSIVRLVPIKELNAFASDHGHIYYYKSPKFKADYMAQNGAILNFSPYP